MSSAISTKHFLPGGRHANGTTTWRIIFLNCFALSDWPPLKAMFRTRSSNEARPEFAEHADLWSQVIENLGEQLAKAGFCMESQLQEERERYRSWARTELMKQTLAMRTITGRAPSNPFAAVAAFRSPACLWRLFLLPDQNPFVYSDRSSERRKTQRSHG